MSEIIPNVTMDSIPVITAGQVVGQSGAPAVPVQPTQQQQQQQQTSFILGADGQPLQQGQQGQPVQQFNQPNHVPQQAFHPYPTQQNIQTQQNVQQNTPVPQPVQTTGTTDFNKDNPVGVDISTGTKAAINLFERSTGNNLQSIMDLASHAIQQGDSSLLNRTALQLQFGENAAQAEAVVQAIIEDTKQARQNIANHCYAKVGGEQQWGQLVNAFRGTADKGTVDAVKTLFDSGHIDVAIGMMQQHVSSSARVPQGNPATMLQGGTNVQQGITAYQLQEAIQNLEKKYPNQSWERGAAAEEYQALLRMRQVGKQAGI